MILPVFTILLQGMGMGSCIVLFNSRVTIKLCSFTVLCRDLITKDTTITLATSTQWIRDCCNNNNYNFRNSYYIRRLLSAYHGLFKGLVNCFPKCHYIKMVAEPTENGNTFPTNLFHCLLVINNVSHSNHNVSHSS